MERRKFHFLVHVVLLVGLLIFLTNPSKTASEKGSGRDPSTANYNSAPTLQWVWNGLVRDPVRSNVFSPIVVINMRDNVGGDGVNACDIPQVAFLHYRKLPGVSIEYKSSLTAVRGTDGEPLWTVSSPAMSWTALAGGDLTGDGVAELVSITAEGNIGSEPQRIVGFDANGNQVINGPIYSSLKNPTDFTISLANIDAVGLPEILVGNLVFDASGTLLWEGSEGKGRINVQKSSTGVDLDLDGDLEVLAGKTAYYNDGSVFWTYGGPTGKDGGSAVGEFDGDPYPEIVFVTLGGSYSLTSHHSEDGYERDLMFPPDSPGPTVIRLLNHDGTLIGTPYEFETYWGRAVFPALGQFDDDPEPELAETDGDTLWRFDFDLVSGTWSETWSFNVEDTSGLSGISLADLDGDCIDEVIYRDEDSLYILDGTDGHREWAIYMRSWTGGDYPGVADIDGDDRMEIVTTSSLNLRQGYYDMDPGVYAFECNAWNDGRRVWNDYTYHVTNINEDGTVPLIQERSWEVDNSFLAQEGPGECGVGLEVYLDIKPTSCPNPLNKKSKGNIPVAILGTATFDVNTINVGSILLEGVEPLRDDVEDVTTPVEKEPCGCECTEEGPDGFPDLTLKFDTQDIVAALLARGEELNPKDTVILTIMGTLLDGTPFKGYDCMIVRGAAIDIKPQTCPNTLPFYCFEPSPLLLPVAVLGLTDFDITEIDTSSILLEGVMPVMESMVDEATPPDTLSLAICNCITLGPDGTLDYLFQFNTCDIVNALKEREDSLAPGDTVLVTLTGKFRDGTPFEGEDCAILIDSTFGPLGSIKAPSPVQFGLFQNVPNPFFVLTEATIIRYGIAYPGHVSLKIYSNTGRLVRTLVEGEAKSGMYILSWDGRDFQESEVASGIYFYRLSVGTPESALDGSRHELPLQTSTKKLILLR